MAAMKSSHVRDSVFRFFRLIYLKLFRINDSPERIAFGLGLGVFFGIVPGMGPLAALFAALLLRANRAAALLGSFATNTWLSVPTFLLAVKAGASLTGSSYSDLGEQWRIFIKDFQWAALFKLSVYRILFPVIIGYIFISFLIGVLTYLAAFILLKQRKKAS